MTQSASNVLKVCSRKFAHAATLAGMHQAGYAGLTDAEEC